MKRTTILLIFLAVCLVSKLTAQDCTTLGQNPESAFPVCGSKEFFQSEVPICGDRKVPTPCTETEMTDKNPFWYKFRCYEPGTLGFVIVPENLADDYDWQLFDITGHSPRDVYSDKNLFVACNWSGYGGKTGASNEGASLVSCSGENPIWSAMPELIEGHDYLLLVSHFSAGQSGYTLTFTGGTAEITDPKAPEMQAADGTCDGNRLYIKLNKPVKCASVAADGTDFSVSAPGVSVIRASSLNCSSNFNTDSLLIDLSEPLPPGNYSVNLKTGSDGNTLLDDCDVPLAPASMGFTSYESVSAEFSYQVKTGCEVDTVLFSHDGAHNVNKWQWAFDEITSATQHPTVTYSTPGSKNAALVVSNEYCSDTFSVALELPAKTQAAFNGPEILCSKDDAVFTDLSTGQIQRYLWNFGNNTTSTAQNPDPFRYPDNSGEQKFRVTLEVTDVAGCTDTAAADVVVVGNCNIMVPSAFSPNKDGRNDELYPTNAFNADNLVFRVYNRFGQLVFETKDWRRKWDGNVNGQPQNTGAYVWTLSYTLRSTGRQYNLRGTTVLVR